MEALLILGNQLFPLSLLSKFDKKNGIIFMREDAELCTHFHYHKQKIAFFLSAMRKYAELLRAEGFEVEYQELDSDQRSYDEAFLKFLNTHKVSKVSFFEIEDKFFEERIHSVLKKIKNIEIVQIASPMFVTTRSQFAEYLSGTKKKPFMKTFYERQRKRLKVLVTKDLEPLGGRWSYDEENRLSLPKNFIAPQLPTYKPDAIDLTVHKIVENKFASHVGSTSDMWLPTDRASALAWLEDFLENRLTDFGPYEDALSDQHPFIHHSVLTPFLNVGLITPQEVITKTLEKGKHHKIPMNSLEGFVRQVIGWREFVRGIYQNFSEKQDTTNFWSHHRKLQDCWYQGTTGIAPLDDVIKKTLKYGYAHHIERLMIVGSLMLLLEVEPQEAHRWFMEMFIDSSDWVMGPNVYGMALFSDGGIFATKPYFCGSNYYKKMGPYKKGDWQTGVDGLYWGFIDKHRDYFKKNPRLSMMVKSYDKMSDEKKETLKSEALKLKERMTSPGRA